MEAIELLGVEGNIAHKNLVFSTVGDPRVFERLPLGPVKPALALSLHTTKPALRERLLPRAPRITPSALVEEGERYARLTGYPIQYQWTLLEGVNDGQDELDAVVELLRGKYALLNMIPYNTVEGLGFRRPSRERSEVIARALLRRGVLTKLRWSAAQDVDGGCGQLRARELVPPVRVVTLHRGITPAMRSPAGRAPGCSRGHEEARFADLGGPCLPGGSSDGLG
jgi:23S rRNA (adenine2503-C2)-methyltransferase